MLKAQAMTTILRAALPHLISAAEQEIARLSVIQDLPDSDWPDEFDPNDIVHLDIALEDIRKALRSGGEPRTVNTKSFCFLVMALPAYVRVNKRQLTATEFEMLENIYSREVGDPSILIPSEAVPYLIMVTDKEMARLKAIHAPHEADWPPDWNVDDLWSLDIIRKRLSVAIGRGGSGEQHLKGMLGARLIRCICTYIPYHRAHLTEHAHQIFKAICDQNPLLAHLYELSISAKQSNR